MRERAQKGDDNIQKEVPTGHDTDDEQQRAKEEQREDDDKLRRPKTGCNSVSGKESESLGELCFWRGWQ